MKIMLQILLLSILLVVGCSSCSLLLPKKPTITEPTIAPTPGVQLWQAAKKSNWLVTASILGMAVGVFAMVNGSAKLGIAAIAATSVSLVMSLAVARFALWLAVFGLIGSSAAALFSILVRRKALVEMVMGIQTLKKHVPKEVNPNSVLAGKQSLSTEKIVRSLKGNLKLQGKIT